jgi:hypothetical protein
MMMMMMIANITDSKRMTFGKKEFDRRKNVYPCL